MSPAVFRAAGLRSCFFSREEPLRHVAAQSTVGEAKCFVEPEVELAVSCRRKGKDVSRVRQLIEEHMDEARVA